MSFKLGAFLKSVPDLLYTWRQRNEKLDGLLSSYIQYIDKLEAVGSSIDKVDKRIGELEKKVETVIEDLNPVKHGTKMELFETLHNWRQLSVVKRGWATAEEKKEIEEIYTIYHDKLGGNGNGERYYKEILALPESEEEKEAKKNV